MKTIQKYVPILLLLLLAMVSCTKDDTPIDPRTDFEGEYKMKPFQYRYLETYEGNVVNDTKLTFEQPHIIVRRAEGYPDKMEMDLKSLSIAVFHHLKALHLLSFPIPSNPD